MVDAGQLACMRGVTDEFMTGSCRFRAGRWLLVTLSLVAVLLAVTGPATATETQALGENDTEAPTWETATKAAPTQIELTFTDNSTIDRGSIAAGDFTVSAGNISNLSVEPADGGLTVTLLLEDRLNVDTVTVGFASNGAIADAEDNELTSGSKTVTGMDTLVPEFERFALTRVDADTVAVRVAANEPLTELAVAVTGPATDRLTRANFTAVDGSNTTFETRYTVPEYGAYSFVWERAVDRSGNPRVMSRMRQFRYEDSAPEVVVDGPEVTTVETTVNFSAAETVDEDGIDSYRWRIDGATVLSGPSIRVAFAAAGRHDITLEVTDSEGHTAVETRQIRVRKTADSPVTVTPLNATRANATVRGTGLVQQVRAENGSLVRTDTVALDRVSAAFPVNTSVSLRFQATDASPAAFDGQSFGLFHVDHATPADRASVRFSVDRAALNRTGVAPGAVVLYRDADGWTPLPTSVVSRTDDRVAYQATAPGLSQFAVGTEPASATASSGSAEPPGDGETDTEESSDTDVLTTAESDGTESPSQSSDGTASGSQPAPRPDITVTNVTVDETAPSVGETVLVSVTATNRGTANGTYPFSVRLNDSSIATYEIAVPAGTTRTRSYEQNLTAEGELSVAGTAVANVSVSSGGSLLPGSITGTVAGLPNPLALWPSGIVGTVLGAFVGLVVVVYGVLKALAIYLGY